ncbi:hypothetical protein NHX12_032688, partial [Muraenolepis orangiensis]
RLVHDVRGDGSCEWTRTVVGILKPVRAAESCPESNPGWGMDTEADDQDPPALRAI